MREKHRSWRNTALRRIQQKPRNIVEAKSRKQEKENNAYTRLGKKPRNAYLRKIQENPRYMAQRRH